MVTDADYAYLGFDSRQIEMLRSQPEHMRQLVYEEGLRILMETGPGYGESTTVTF